MDGISFGEIQNLSAHIAIPMGDHSGTRMVIRWLPDPQNQDKCQSVMAYPTT